MIERLDETHQGKTQVTIGRYNNQLMVCKVIYHISRQYQKIHLLIKFL